MTPRNVLHELAPSIGERIRGLSIDESVSAIDLIGAEGESALRGLLSSPEPQATEIDAATLAGMLDHTNLKPDAGISDVDRLCDEALEHGFAAVCVNSRYLPRVVRRLDGSTVAPCVVCDFPLGASLTDVRASAAKRYSSLGATEIDVVVPIGIAKSGRWREVLSDVETIVGAAAGSVVKVIIETALLSDAEKVVASAVVMSAGAAFVKTSTGFGPGGATVRDVRILRAVVADRCGVKAAGGVRERTFALDLIAAGATRIGASASVGLVSLSGGGE
jgi:deoxyribose-phosphate aldolase